MSVAEVFSCTSTSCSFLLNGTLGSDATGKKRQDLCFDSADSILQFSTVSLILLLSLHCVLHACSFHSHCIPIVDLRRQLKFTQRTTFPALSVQLVLQLLVAPFLD